MKKAWPDCWQDFGFGQLPTAESTLIDEKSPMERNEGPSGYSSSNLRDSGFISPFHENKEFAFTKPSNRRQPVDDISLLPIYEIRSDQILLIAGFIKCPNRSVSNKFKLGPNGELIIQKNNFGSPNRFTTEQNKYPYCEVDMNSVLTFHTLSSEEKESCSEFSEQPNASAPICRGNCKNSTEENLQKIRTPKGKYSGLQQKGEHRKEVRFFCKFCHKNGEPYEIYSAHFTKTLSGKVMCPILRNYVCEMCGATGDNAHTRRYCPQFYNSGLED